MSIIHFKSKLFKRFHYNPFSGFCETTENLIKTTLKGPGLQTRLHFSKTYLRDLTGLKRKLCTKLDWNPFNGFGE